jgi:4-hydroxybenzoate polyprenyltransferase
VIAYFAERLRPLVFLPAAGALALSAHFGGSHQDGCLFVDGVMALLLLAQFRLWDDLADRESDRRHHPNRVLVRARRTTRFVAVCLMLAEVNFVAVTWRSGLAGAIALGVVHLAAAGFYLVRPKRRTALGDLLLLAKYPAFVVVLSATPLTPSTALFWSALSVYAAACVVEIVHDPSGPLSRTLRSLRAVHHRHANARSRVTS